MATTDTGNIAADVREKVREHYRESALKVTSGEQGCCSKIGDPVAVSFYTGKEASEVPQEALLASLGCGNPTALARLNPGEVVLDLGSGGGIDVLLSAKRVGPTGFAYGLDMTDEMLALAEENRVKAGVENVKFLKGYIEEIPLPDSSVDVIISNCVINLAADKRPVLKEAFRVLRPGGRFAVTDVVVRGNIPPALRRNIESWTECVSGALREDEYKDLLAEAGFTDVGIEVVKTYSASDAVDLSGGACCSSSDVLPLLDKATAEQLAQPLFISAFVRAVKPTS